MPLRPTAVTLCTVCLLVPACSTPLTPIRPFLGTELIQVPSGSLIVTPDGQTNRVELGGFFMSERYAEEAAALKLEIEKRIK